MPELPEVETVKRGLEPILGGALIERVEQNRPDLRFAFPKDFATRLSGQRVGTLARRAKYLLVPLSGGETLVIHLGMSGRITIEKEGEPESEAADRPNPAHDHVVLHLAKGASIRYNDPRRFGFMTLVKSDELEDHKLFCKLGPEPLGNQFHAHYLALRAKARKTALKNFLLDQSVVAGLGNIYVCEALFRGQIDPRRPARILARKNGQPTVAAQKLVPHIRTVLEEAIKAGGSTLRDHRLTDGSLGYFQHSFAVYGRAGEPCQRKNCTGTISRLIQSGRSTFHCPKCQK